jgi:HME family heavy-metal exporter
VPGANGAAGRHIVGDAARERAVPLTQSVLVTAAVLLPATILGTRAGLEFLHPLAVTMLGGLASLLLVQVFVLPAFLLPTVRRKQEPAPEAPHAPGPPDVRHPATAPG